MWLGCWLGRIEGTELGWLVVVTVELGISDLLGMLVLGIEDGKLVVVTTVGACDGNGVAGANEGMSEGSPEGGIEASVDCTAVVACVGIPVDALVGFTEGESYPLGLLDGTSVRSSYSRVDGAPEGTWDGAFEVGLSVGTRVGMLVGFGVGSMVGDSVVSCGLPADGVDVVALCDEVTVGMLVGNRVGS